jgi:ATP-binding cassette subfamily F protein 3
MSLLTVSGVVKGFGAQTVLDGVSVRVARGEKIGIVGKNGGGKTTLLKMLIGRETPDRGTIHVARGVRIGYLSQIADLDENHTVRQEAETALVALADAEAELRETEQALAENPDDEEALDAYAAACDRFEFAGGDQARQNLDAAMQAMGFCEADLDKSVLVLSGGEKTRLSMAKLLTSSPDILALDEPTNHLDIRAVEWLEGFLTRYAGAVIVVSHDRRLLERIVGTVWEVEANRVNVYGGGYVKYREQRAAIRARQLEDFERQRAEIARTEEYIRRNKAGQNARNAMGRAKQLARVERLERPPDDPKQMKARLDSSGRGSRDVVIAERATKRYGAKVLLDNLTVTVERGMRVGVVGGNGAGKTTLIQMIVGEESPDAGYVRSGQGVTVAYHKQEVDDFDPEDSVLDSFYDRAGMTIGEARSHLGKFLFTGEDVFKPVSALSGGERAKLGMALMVLSPANLLILDEPTNHLDVFSCDALTDALADYAGTLLLVSHDRALLDAVTDHTLAFEGDGRVRLVKGAYSVYRAELDNTAQHPNSSRSLRKAPTSNSPSARVQERRTGGEDASRSGSETSRPGAEIYQSNLSPRELSKERQRLTKRVAALETEVGESEGRLAEIEKGLSSPTSTADAISLSLDYERVKDELAVRMMEWEAATADAEAVGAPV